MEEAEGRKRRQEEDEEEEVEVCSTQAHAGGYGGVRVCVHLNRQRRMFFENWPGIFQRSGVMYPLGGAWRDRCVKSVCVGVCV